MLYYLITNLSSCEQIVDIRFGIGWYIDSMEVEVDRYKGTKSQSSTYRRNFIMKRKVLKTGAITLALSMFCSIGAFANQTREVEYTDDPFSSSYIDSYNITHYISGIASCNAVAEWIEGYYGWFISAYFPRPYATIDGNRASLEYNGKTKINGSIAYQEFSINSSSNIVRPTIGCDEYGDIFFYVKCW